MRIDRLAIARLSLAGQRALIAHPDRRIRGIIASSPTTHPDVIDTLAQDPDIRVKRQALPRTRNEALLREILSKVCSKKANADSDTPSSVSYDGGSRNATYAARNPLAPAELLGGLLRNKNKTLAFAVFCNTNTPEAVRRKLTLQQAKAIIDYNVGGTSYDGNDGAECRLMRAYELVLNNSWILNDPTGWDWRMLQGISGMPNATKEVLQYVHSHAHYEMSTISVAGASRWAKIQDECRQHPAWTGKNIDTLDMNSLLANQTVATDLAAVTRPEFNYANARTLLERKTSAMPHVLGRIINRCGALVLRGLTNDATILGRDAKNAVDWSAPIIWYATRSIEISQQEVDTAHQILGESSENWTTLLNLLPDWHGDIVEAAQAACKL